MAIDFLAARKEILDTRDHLIGESEEAHNMRTFANRAGMNDATVLLQGETGSGKDHLAELIHLEGRRYGQSGSFVTVDCGSMTDTLWESEMFGHIQGAFTDAREAKKGLMETAEGGTLFFDEIGNMTPLLQAKLLRITEKKPYRPLGSTKEKTVNLRIVLATNMDLPEAVAKGQFRADLYHRINILAFRVPPLRDRREDIPILAQHLLLVAGSQKTLHPRAVSALSEYDWPGNVRELKNVMTKSDFNSYQDKVILEKHVSPCLEGVGCSVDTNYGQFTTYKQFQKNYFAECLRRSCGNFKRGAKIAGISTRIFRYSVGKLGLDGMVEKLNIREE